MFRGTRSRSGTATPVGDIVSPLLRAPPEIVHRILLHCDGLEAIARTAQTCQDLKYFINDDEALWRDLLLARYDAPRAWREARDCSSVLWRSKLKDRTLVDRMLLDREREEWRDLTPLADLISSTLHDVYLDIPPSKQGAVEDVSLNAQVLDNQLAEDKFKLLYSALMTGKSYAELEDATDLDVLPSILSTKGRRQIPALLSKLHILNPSPSSTVQERVTRAEQRKVTYSIDNISPAGGYGPFSAAGRVDWGLVDALGSVMMANAKDALMNPEAGWQAAAKPLTGGIDTTKGINPLQLERPTDLAPGQIWDWAGVHGVWRGSYAFLDYSDWVALNHPSIVPQLRRRPSLDLLNYSEAVGDLQKIRFKVCTNHPSTLIGSLPDFTETCPTSALLPTLFFHGVPRSRQEIRDEIQAETQLSLDDATLEALVEEAHQTSPTFLRGCVRLTTDDPPEVRWTFVVRYGGADRWQMEGVQVGGIGSRRGIFGNWTDVERSVDSPCGPIWYWKT